MPCILVFFGMIASGKSFLAQEYARRKSLLYLNTDRVRKELAGIEATLRCTEGPNQGIYTPEFSRRTYDAMLARAEQELDAGRSLVLDGSYSTVDERERVLVCGGKHGAAVFFVLCSCPEKETARRLELRARDPEAVSDGRWEIYLGQKKTFMPPDELEKKSLLRLETVHSLNHLLGRVEDFVRDNNSNP